MKKIISIILVLILLLIAGCIKTNTPPSFLQEECDATNPCSEGLECIKLPDKPKPLCVNPKILQTEYKDCDVLESYPIQVRCPEKKALIDEECSLDSDCKISGCNSEICSKEEMISICVYKPEFECYKLSNCKCINAKCGWEQTKEFSSCLESKQQEV